MKTLGSGSKGFAVMVVLGLSGCTEAGDSSLNGEPDAGDAEVEATVGDPDGLAEVETVLDTSVVDMSVADSSVADTAPETAIEIAEPTCTGTLCADFEDDSAGAQPSGWTVASPSCGGSGTLVVDGEVAHGGAKSLRINGGGGYCDHVFAQTNTLPTGALWLRFASALPDNHVTFLAMRDAADNNKDLRQGGQSRIFMWNRESDDATLPELSPTGIAASKAPEVNTWTCVEAHIDPATGLLETCVGGTLVSGLVIDGTPPPDVDRAVATEPPQLEADDRPASRLGELLGRALGHSMNGTW